MAHVAADEHALTATWYGVDSEGYAYDSYTLMYNYTGDTFGGGIAYTQQDTGSTYIRAYGNYTRPVGDAQLTINARYGRLDGDYSSTEAAVDVYLMQELEHGYAAAFTSYGTVVPDGFTYMDDTSQRTGATLGWYATPSLTLAYTASVDEIYGGEGIASLVTLKYSTTNWDVIGYATSTTQDYVQPNMGIALKYKW